MKKEVTILKQQQGIEYCSNAQLTIVRQFIAMPDHIGIINFRENYLAIPSSYKNIITKLCNLLYIRKLGIQIGILLIRYYIDIIIFIE